MFYSKQKKQLYKLNRRSFALLTFKFTLLSIISARLFNIQITNSSKYKTLSKNNPAFESEPVVNILTPAAL